MLKIRLENDWDQSPEDVAVSVFDGYGDVVLDKQEGSYEVLADVGEGLYTIRVETAGGMREETVRVKGETDVTVKLPDLYSPIPIKGAATTHEYYEGPTGVLTAYDNAATSDPIGDIDVESGDLIIIIRTSNKKVAPAGDLGDGLVLCDLDGQPLRPIDLENTQRLDQGFQGFRATIEPGIYSLEYPNDPQRQLFLQVFADRQTQVFVTYWHRPLIEEAGILLPGRHEIFSAFDEENRAADLAIRGLINNENWLPKEAMQTLLHGKFHNPMLGLLGAFLIIRREKPDWYLLKQVIGNLNDLLPGSVDVQILLQLLAEAGQDLPYGCHLEPVLTKPPMLRVAMEFAIEVSWKHPDYIASGSLVEQVALNLYSDSAWCSSKLIVPYVAERTYTLTKSVTTRGTAQESDWVAESIRQLVSIEKERKTDINPTELAQRMG